MKLNKFSKTTSLIFAVLLFTTQLTSNYALAYDTNFYSSNDILFYDPDASAPACGSASTSLNGAANLEQIYNFLLGKGLSDVQAAGAVGNIAIESHGDPTVVQGGSHTNNPSTLTTSGHAYGIIQWDPGAKIVSTAKNAGVTGNIYELSTQLNILWWNLTDTTPTGTKNFISQYKSVTDVTKATEMFVAKVEGTTSAIPDRVAAAKLALSYLKNPSVSVTSGTSSADCSGSVAGSAVQTAVNYAWPTFHSAPYLVMKPSYAAATAVAQAAGKYVGGGIHPGVDCGGFVTRVMQDSGVDPNYNLKSPGGTVSQWNYMVASGKYTEIHPKTTTDMQPGDIAINSDHTYMYVGKVDGFSSTTASSSYSTSGLSWRTPMAGAEAPADPNYHWFRKVQ